MALDAALARPRRTKISATVDARLLQRVDAFVKDHTGTDRSKVLDEALTLWWAREQERAMADQFAPGEAPEEEIAQWRALRAKAATRRFRDRP